TEKPSLKRFLEFRLTEGNLESEEEEHLRYICEINTISKYYTETSEIGQKLLTWNQDFKARFIQFIEVGEVVSLSCSAPSPTTLLVATGTGKGCVLVGEHTIIDNVCVTRGVGVLGEHVVLVYNAMLQRLPCWLRTGIGKGCNDKKSKEITHFWDLQDKRQNVHSEKLLFEEEAKMSQNKLENQIYLEQTRYILDATRERSLLQRTITNRFEKYVSDNTLQPVVSQINENERKRHAEEISHTITTPPNLRPSVEEKKADDHFFFSDQIVKGNEDTSYERRRRCSIPEDNVAIMFSNAWLSRKRLLTSQVLLQINLEEFPSVTTTTSLYVPSSPPSTSDCNISEEYTIVENRSYSIDYLTGPGVPEWHLNEDSIRWVVNDIDITEICREYRAVVVKKCESMDVTLSATEEL
ncbi:11224_t:CDS:2, partial [Scutellospora calospora]